MESLSFCGLGAGAVVLLDSSALAYHVEGGTRRAELTAAFLAAAGRGEARLIASTLAWTEVLAGPLARQDAEAAARARRLLADSSRIVLEPLDAAIAEAAAMVIAAPAASSRVSTADAVHIATALVLGADAILTNDGAWRSIVAGMDEASLRQIGGGRKGGAPRRPEILLIDELLFDFE